MFGASQRRLSVVSGDSSLKSTRRTSGASPEPKVMSPTDSCASISYMVCNDANLSVNALYGMLKETVSHMLYLTSNLYF